MVLEGYPSSLVQEVVLLTDSTAMVLVPFLIVSTRWLDMYLAAIIGRSWTIVFYEGWCFTNLYKLKLNFKWYEIKHMNVYLSLKDTTNVRKSCPMYGQSHLMHRHSYLVYGQSHLMHGKSHLR